MRKFGFYLIISYLLIFTANANPNSIKKGSWKFRFQSSFGINDYKLQKQYYKSDAVEMGVGLLVRTAAMNFKDHASRLSYLKSQCQHFSEIQIIQMGRYLSAELEKIYDYDRYDGEKNSNKVITPNDQWNGLGVNYSTNKANKVGVCRDMASSVSELLLTCGIDQNRISIESYRTFSGGHQIVTVNGKDGKTYTINWSELYSTKTDFRSHIPNPGLINTGIVHTKYDPSTGKIIDERYTELGHILAAVTKGKVDDENYNPQLLQIEANNNVLTFGTYISLTSRNDLLKGIKIAYEKRPTTWFHYTTGMTYAHQESQFYDANKTFEDSSQHILFYQFYGSIDIPKVQLLKFQDSELYWKNNIEFSTAIAGYFTHYQNEYFANFDITIRPSLSSGVFYNSARYELGAKTGIDFGINERVFNSEVNYYFNKGVYPYIYQKGYFTDARVTLKDGQFNWIISGDTYHNSYGYRFKLNFQMIDKKNIGLYSFGFLRYSNQLDMANNFLILQMQKQWKMAQIAKIGLGMNGQLSIDPDQLGNSIYFSISLEPGHKASDED